MTDAQLFALIGLVVLVSVLVLAEMFERAIENDLEEHDSYDPRASAERTAHDRE